jgi:hypothetical protein
MCPPLPPGAHAPIDSCMNKAISRPLRTPKQDKQCGAYLQPSIHADNIQLPHCRSVGVPPHSLRPLLLRQGAAHSRATLILPGVEYRGFKGPESIAASMDPRAVAAALCFALRRLTFLGHLCQCRTAGWRGAQAHLLVKYQHQNIDQEVVHASSAASV